MNKKKLDPSPAHQRQVDHTKNGPRCPRLFLLAVLREWSADMPNVPVFQALCTYTSTSEYEPTPSGASLSPNKKSFVAKPGFLISHQGFFPRLNMRPLKDLAERGIPSPTSGYRCPQYICPFAQRWGEAGPDYRGLGNVPREAG
jgi:hypothetical protein